MRSKPDLVPDCDVHGEPMYRDESPASALGLKGNRDVIVWRCAREGCGRYFHGTVGYRYCPRPSALVTPTPHCEHEAAFLVVQRALGSYICPVAGCSTAQVWQASVAPLRGARSARIEPNSSTSSYGHHPSGRGSFAFSTPLILPGKPSCSFCDRGEDALGGLIPSPLNDDPQKPLCYICAECVVVCNMIIESTTPDSESPSGGVAQHPARNLAPRR
jgi:ClpX C4-type zinc finger